MAKKSVKKVVLAYSGGLDTSVILKWLQTAYGAEVVTFTADLGQGDELGPARARRPSCSASSPRTSSSRICARNSSAITSSRCSAPMRSMKASICWARPSRGPLIAKKQIEIAEKMGADAVAHGSTGKGNDQVRFELTYYALKPDIKMIAPWREWELTSRTKLLEFAEAHQIPIAKDKRGEAPFSVDANLLHSSSEGKVLEDPAVEAGNHRLSAHHCA